MSKDHPLRFRVLGPFGIDRDGVPLELTVTPKAQLLFVALLLDAPKPVPEDRLDQRVFGETGNKVSRHHYLTQLRRFLGSDSDVLPRERDGQYRLAVDRRSIDLVRFTDAVQRGRAAYRSGDPASARHLRDALACWTGDEPFARLSGDWIAAKRLDLLRERRDAELLLHRIQLSDGAAGEALAALASLRADHPADENVVALSLAGLAAQGDRDAARSVFTRYASHLREHLGVQPAGWLRELHDRIEAHTFDAQAWLLDGRAVPSDPPAVVAVPRMVPAALPKFVGRLGEVHDLDLARERSQVIVIDGMPGVGKTALLRFWAHRVAEHYPGGVLHLDLLGFDPAGTAVTEPDALRLLLTGLGIDDRDVRAGLQQRRDQYYSAVAGRRLLLVLDNAANAEQVRPLIPPGSEALVVVASRRRLPALGAGHQATFVSLGLPEVAEARELFRSYLGERAGEPAADIDAIVEWAHCMPLALAVVGSRAATRPSRSLPEILAQLRSEFTAPPGTDPRDSVTAALHWSYRILAEPHQRAFRLLALHPGTVVAPRPAAALLAAGTAVTTGCLDVLTQVRLVEDAAGGRYTQHDVVREYAAALLAGDEPADRDAATLRLYDFYLHSADNLANLLRGHRQPLTLDPPVPGVQPMTAVDVAEAIGWFQDEFDTLMRLIRSATRVGLSSYAWKILTTMVDFLDWQGRWTDWDEAAGIARATAVAAGDRVGVARSSRSLGRAALHAGRYAGADTHLHAALEAYRELNDRDGQMRLHFDLGDLRLRQRRPDAALSEATESLRLARALGNEQEEGNALGGMAWCCHTLDRHEEAASYARAAIAIHQRTGFAHGEAAAQDTLGVALCHLGDREEARSSLQRSAALCHHTGDRIGEAVALDHLGDACDGPERLTAWQQALSIFGELKNPMGEAVAAKLRDAAAR